MPRYVGLFNWTDQGVKTAKDTVGRQKQSEEAFAKMGLTLQTVLWTQGRYDLVAVFEAPDDATVAAAMLTLGKAGNVRTETLRGFSAEEMEAVLQRVG
jgi:uncharacterized protein with GYD domain